MMNPPLYYSDNQTQIQPCQPDTASLRAPGRDCENGLTINSGLVADDVNFDLLYDKWIRPCLILMDRTVRVDHDAVEALFFPPQDGAARDDAFAKEFILRFGRLISGTGEFKKSIWPLCDYFGIYDAVDQALSGAPDYYLTRVKAVCALMAAHPQIVFAEGANWPNAFLPDISAGQKKTITGGEAYTLSLDRPERLIPGTLVNPDGAHRPITVEYENHKYTVGIPANGFLRVVFNEKNELVNIKGAVSVGYDPFNNANACAIIQGPGAALSCLSFVTRGLWEINGVQGYLDAAAGSGLANVLMRRGVFRAATGTVDAQNPAPIRVYGGGTDWAFLYADGTVKTSAGGLNRAYSVVENGCVGLMFVNEEGAWELSYHNLRKTDKDVFVDCMLSRFRCDGGASERVIVAPYNLTISMMGNGNITFSPIPTSDKGRTKA